MSAETAQNGEKKTIYVLNKNIIKYILTIDYCLFIKIFVTEKGLSFECKRICVPKLQ